MPAVSVCWGPGACYLQPHLLGCPPSTEGPQGQAWGEPGQAALAASCPRGFSGCQSTGDMAGRGKEADEQTRGVCLLTLLKMGAGWGCGDRGQAPLRDRGCVSQGWVCRCGLEQGRTVPPASSQMVEQQLQGPVSRAFEKTSNNKQLTPTGL